MIKVPDVSYRIKGRLLYFLKKGFGLITTSFEGLPEVLNVEEGSVVLVTAPTGTGKSTDMINALKELSEGKHQKVVVVVPRSLLVIGLVGYMRDRFGPDFSGATTGIVLDETARVWYITPQELFINRRRFMNGRYLYIIDEAHLDEPFMNVAKLFVKRHKAKMIYATATPTKQMIDEVDYSLALKVHANWGIVETHTGFNGTMDKDYVNHVLELTHQNRSMFNVFLIFCPKISMVERLVNTLPGRACPIMRGVANVPKNMQYYVCTDIADVGITIPDVNIVISPTVRPCRDHPKTKQWTRCSHELLRQRRGRTGRTNHGKIIYTTPSECDIKDEEPIPTTDYYEVFIEAGADPAVLLELGIAKWNEIKSFYGTSNPKGKDYSPFSSPVADFVVQVCRFKKYDPLVLEGASAHQTSADMLSKLHRAIFQTEEFSHMVGPGDLDKAAEYIAAHGVQQTAGCNHGVPGQACTICKDGIDYHSGVYGESADYILANEAQSLMTSHLLIQFLICEQMTEHYENDGDPNDVPNTIKIAMRNVLARLKAQSSVDKSSGLEGLYSWRDLLGMVRKFAMLEGIGFNGFQFEDYGDQWAVEGLEDF
jgi:hypothetical protein